MILSFSNNIQPGDRKLRKQYHFRPSKNGYYAWDVHRLIALSKNFKPIQVPVDSIQELDENFWFGGENDVATCRKIVNHIRLIEAADLSYPIILASDSRVMDGMHRVAKSLLLGKTEISAVQFRQDPKPDYEDVYPDDLPY